MDVLTLEANYRSNLSKGYAKQIRRNGFVTGSVFGHNVQPIALEVKLADLINQIKQSPTGIKALINLKVMGAPVDADGTVIIKDYHKDPLTRKLMDIQFQHVSMKETVNVGVPITLVGEPKSTEGTVEQGLDELQIKTLPGNIPSAIEVDTTDLEPGHAIKVSDLNLGEGV
ncbi:50S ribosomal protein L25, partial [bacterium]|nr:50S ribosomal protein L25 [bacterium]